MFELPCGVERVHVDHDESGTKHGRDGHHVLRQIGHHERNARALGQALGLKPRAKRAGQLVDLAERDPRLHANGGLARCVTAKRLF